MHLQMHVFHLAVRQNLEGIQGKVGIVTLTGRVVESTSGFDERGNISNVIRRDAGPVVTIRTHNAAGFCLRLDVELEILKIKEQLVQRTTWIQQNMRHGRTQAEVPKMSEDCEEGEKE